MCASEKGREAQVGAELEDAHTKKLHDADSEKKEAASSEERSAMEAQVSKLHADLAKSARALTSQTVALTKAREQARSAFMWKHLYFMDLVPIKITTRLL
jgi:hypothetical protein